MPIELPPGDEPPRPTGDGGAGMPGDGSTEPVAERSPWGPPPVVGEPVLVAEPELGPEPVLEGVPEPELEPEPVLEPEPELDLEPVLQPVLAPGWVPEAPDPS
jgi:fused signal recognition particle receptor